MKKNYVALIDIGSSKIIGLVGQRGVNNTYIFNSIKTVDYSGYQDGAFFDEKELEDSILSVLNYIKHETHIKTDKIFIGVPGNFVLVKTSKHKINFSKNKKIKLKDINNLTDENKNDLSGYTLIKTSPFYYLLGDNKKTDNPLNCKSDFLKGSFSCFYCDNNFIDLFKKIFKDTQLIFLPVSLAELKYLMSDDLRELPSVLVDIGYISTTFSIVYGNGIMYQKSFSFGGGYISAYLSNALDIDFYIAERIKNRANLNNRVNAADFYEIYDDDQQVKLPAKQVNDVIEYGMDELCDYINACLNDYNNGEFNNIYLTGGGLSLIRGGYEYMSHKLSKEIECLAPSLPFYNKPDQSSIISLLEMALSTKNKFYK